MSPFRVSTDCKYDGYAAQTGYARYTQCARYTCFVRTVEKVQAILSPYQRKACFGHGGQSVRIPRGTPAAISPQRFRKSLPIVVVDLNDTIKPRKLLLQLPGLISDIIVLITCTERTRCP